VMDILHWKLLLKDREFNIKTHIAFDRINRRKLQEILAHDGVSQ
jgi:hypothetical protein